MVISTLMNTFLITSKEYGKENKNNCLQYFRQYRWGRVHKIYLPDIFMNKATVSNRKDNNILTH